MKTEAKIKIKNSRQHLEKILKSNFDMNLLPSQSELFDFLKKFERNCLIDKNAAVAPIIVTDSSGLLTKEQILCLPPSHALSNNFIKNLSGYLQEVAWPVILYWAWKVNQDKEEYVSLRLTLTKNNKILHLTPEILHPTYGVFSNALFAEIIFQLGEQLSPDYTMQLIKPLKTNGWMQGDNLYWAALSLLLALTESSQHDHDQFKKWTQQHNKKTLTQIKIYSQQLLNIAPCLNTNLFYCEQVFAIANMSFLKRKVERLVTDDATPSFLEELPLCTMLRGTTLGYLIFYERDYVALSQIPLILSLQYLTRSLSKRIPQGALQIILIYFSHLLMYGSRLAIQLYSQMPINPTHFSIFAPRYILDWTVKMLQETLQLLFKIPSLLLMMFTLEQVMNSGSDQENRELDLEDQAGLLALSFLAIQSFTGLLKPYLPTLESWEFRQQSEENVLQAFRKTAENENAELTIDTDLSSRVLSHISNNNQTLFFNIKYFSNITEVETIRNCTLNIRNQKPCSHYQLNCWMKFFKRISEKDLLKNNELIKFSDLRKENYPSFQKCGKK